MSVSNKYCISISAVQAIIEVGGSIPEHEVLPVTSSSRTHASLLLSKMYDDLYQDTQRDKYRIGVDAYFSDMFGDEIFESKIEAVMALACLLQVCIISARCVYILTQPYA